MVDDEVVSRLFPATLRPALRFCAGALFNSCSGVDTAIRPQEGEGGFWRADEYDSCAAENKL